ncbi:TB2/DP1, HVA22 family-domain-containing protein [Infundibulicybe gibba]|nr:TB2/DP1, HVA22 family-domain-containing protein [Infundibulicybe gibba]
MSAQKIQQHPLVAQAQSKATYYITQLDKELGKYPVLNTLEQRTQVPKAYSAIGAVFILTLLHFINPLAKPVSNLVGWALPAYLSFKALETQTRNDDVQWLTYWVVFGFFNFLESIALRLVLYYLPWYFALKTVFILYLQLPAFRGAERTYFVLLKPVLANISSQSRAVAPSTTTTTEAASHE